MIKKFICVTSEALDPPSLHHKLSHLLGPPPPLRAWCTLWTVPLFFHITASKLAMRRHKFSSSHKSNLTVTNWNYIWSIPILSSSSYSMLPLITISFTTFLDWCSGYDLIATILRIVGALAVNTDLTLAQYVWSCWGWKRLWIAPLKRCYTNYRNEGLGSGIIQRLVHQKSVQ